jgi:hypothetical protein
MAKKKMDIQEENRLLKNLLIGIYALCLHSTNTDDTVSALLETIGPVVKHKKPVANVASVANVA